MTQSGNPRFYGLDALRGFAILTMVLSGIIPYRILPSWMYHAQVPPPDHVFNPNLPGITWVDLVFPFFLFALGAAIPLALGRRLKYVDEAAYTLQGWWESWLPIGKGILERVFLLAFFALFVQHSNPWLISKDPGWQVWLLQLARFACLFAIFARWPKHWSSDLRSSIHIAGWLGALLFLMFTTYANGTGFSFLRNDIIIVVLANTALFGTIVWLVTRRNWWLRIGILGVLAAFRLAHGSEGWIKVLWDFSPFTWLYQLYFLQYLFIVIPGTMIGDMIAQWMGEANDGDRHQLPGLSAVLMMLLLFIPLELIGLKARWVTPTVLLSIGLAVAVWLLIRHWDGVSGRYLKRFYVWGVYWLMLGLMFEPYEGGIKKDHPTLSYYFLTTGLAIILLMAFIIIIDIWRKPGYLKLLIDSGQNPMIAYVGMKCIIHPIIQPTGIFGLMEKLTSAPWPGFFRGLFLTIVLAWIVSVFTHKKLFWRA